MAPPVIIGTAAASLRCGRPSGCAARCASGLAIWTLSFWSSRTQGDKILDVPLAQVGGKGTVR